MGGLSWNCVHELLTNNPMLDLGSFARTQNKIYWISMQSVVTFISYCMLVRLGAIIQLIHV